MGDHNCAKGKAGYPTIGFECIINFRHQIIGIFWLQFGTRNNKEIVKVARNVHLIVLDGTRTFGGVTTMSMAMSI
jgi:hypothetical protein